MSTPETSTNREPDQDRTEQTAIRCPIHAIPDCSPLLNGCNLPAALRWHDRALVDAAVKGVIDTYRVEGRHIWWRNWVTRDSHGARNRLLQQARGYGGMVAT